ncbi:NADH-quinone oxidoreductase subunit J [Dysgonomonas sp. Marseille-P4677]|uniref:NADH-quinone oxidoreductase subunit J family protein n=1 Tax=Dysgonomonas sp. Marseille-P4677 TaxID=2364790 RepID=UPI0019116B23|nr:NADH-quinone oxidoreductase subunit J [Dysgonomonas sp. Marseille-P4677]MBK5719974.1 NADH-quinone oxidoreductase subunit J [Dysgonomonas sp. Marseille-P4677]
MITIIFYILAAITLGTAILTVMSKNPVHSAVYMIICFFSISGHFLLLNALFLAVVNVVVYAGAIMVLLLFTLMLMNLSEQHEPKKKVISRIAATISACLMGIVLLASLLKSAPVIETYKAEGFDYQSVNVIGEVLLNEYLVPFEFASILLLTAMIGAVLISKREKKA